MSGSLFFRRVCVQVAEFDRFQSYCTLGAQVLVPPAAAAGVIAPSP